MSATRDAVLYDYMMQFVGTPYLYGGNVPGDGGVDCSGLALIYLQAARKWSHGADANAQALFNAFRTRRILLGSASFGDMAFFGPNEQDIGHVGLVLIGGAEALMLEAGGGDGTTTSPAAAAVRDAMVRVRPVTFRKDYLAICRP